MSDLKKLQNKETYEIEKYFIDNKEVTERQYYAVVDYSKLNSLHTTSNTTHYIHHATI